MADRISSAVSAPADTSSSTSAATTSAVDTGSTGTSTAVADPPAETTEPVETGAPDTGAVTLEDDLPEINFDEDPEPPEPAQPADQAGVQQDDANSAAELAKVLNAGGLDKRVEDALVKTNRGRHLLQTYKTMRDLRAPVELDADGVNRGGIGFIPNSDQIRDFYKSHSDMQAMEHEFGTNPSNFVLNWFGPDGNGQFRDGVAGTIAAIPQMLDQVYAQANETGNEALRKQAVDLYASAFKPMLSSYLEGLYERARSLQEGPDRQAFLNAARAIENDVFGKFREDAQLAPPKPEDSLKAREDALKAREESLRSWNMKNQSEAARQARDKVFQEIGQRLDADIEKAFAQSNLKSVMKPFAYQAAVNTYRQQIMSAVQRDAYAWRQYNFAMSKVGSQRGAGAHAEAVQVYRQSAQQAIRNSIRNVIKDLVDDQVSQNKAVHASAAATASRVAPAANGGQPSPQSVVAQPPKLTRNPGESNVEYNQRRIAAAMARPA